MSSSTTLPLLEAQAGARTGILTIPDKELLAWFQERNQPAMRLKQIRRQIALNRAESFDSMSDLPLTLRHELAQTFSIFSNQVLTHQQSSDETHKLLLQLDQGGEIECVLIQEDDRRTACISTQVGCGMGCVFCASGLNGFERNLRTYEIMEQLLRLRNCTAAGERLTHIVVMGMGEPLANLDHLLEALTFACAPTGLGIGARHITISTVGLPSKIRRLADLQKQYHLAISLHAPNDDLRSEIVPTNEQTGLTDILLAADYFFEKTSRQVTYEYVLLGGLNDQASQARELATLLQGRKAHVNLIPWNNVQGMPYQRPKLVDQSRFIEILTERGISVKVRKRKGADIDAACGQLRRKLLEQNNTDSLTTATTIF